MANVQFFCNLRKRHQRGRAIVGEAGVKSPNMRIWWRKGFKGHLALIYKNSVRHLNQCYGMSKISRTAAVKVARQGWHLRVGAKLLGSAWLRMESFKRYSQTE